MRNDPDEVLVYTCAPVRMADHGLGVENDPEEFKPPHDDYVQSPCPECGHAMWLGPLMRRAHAINPKTKLMCMVCAGRKGYLKVPVRTLGGP